MTDSHWSHHRTRANPKVSRERTLSGSERLTLEMSEVFLLNISNDLLILYAVEIILQKSGWPAIRMNKLKTITKKQQK